MKLEKTAAEEERAEGKEDAKVSRTTSVRGPSGNESPRGQEEMERVSVRECETHGTRKKTQTRRKPVAHAHRNPNTHTPPPRTDGADDRRE